LERITRGYGATTVPTKGGSDQKYTLGSQRKEGVAKFIRVGTPTKRLSNKIYILLCQRKEGLTEHTHHYTNKTMDQPNTHINMAA